MDGYRLGLALGRAWHEDNESYRLCRVEAIRRIPNRGTNLNWTPKYLKRVNEETLRVYREFKRGKILLKKDCFGRDVT